MKERWKPVVGHEGFYEVSSLGRVRAVFWGNHGQFRPGRILKPHVSSNGYVRIELNAPGRNPIKRTLHTLVLDAFHGCKCGNQEARHLDGVRSNNGSDNLAWGTKSENAEDAKRHGTFILGERHPLSKLNRIDVVAIRDMRRLGMTYQSIAEKFGIDQSNVYCIVKRKTWAHV